MLAKRLIAALVPGDRALPECANRSCGDAIEGAAVRHATEGRSYCSMECLLAGDGGVR